jgi:hypothetical protein
VAGRPLLPLSPLLLRGLDSSLHFDMRYLENFSEGVLKVLILPRFWLRLWHSHTVSFLAVFFRNLTEYQDHCLRHRVEVGAKDCPDYENKALEFLTQPPTSSMHECKRIHGDVVRYDSITDEFAVFSFDGFIRTYFKPTVAWHGLASNLAYFGQECAK